MFLRQNLLSLLLRRLLDCALGVLIMINSDILNIIYQQFLKAFNYMQDTIIINFRPYFDYDLSLFDLAVSSAVALFVIGFVFNDGDYD